jgi:hypothetical protein
MALRNLFHSVETGVQNLLRSLGVGVGSGFIGTSATEAIRAYVLFKL